MSRYGTTVGIAGNATVKTIPLGTTLTYTGGASHSLTVFNSIDKGIDADVATTYGSQGEWLSDRKRNERIEVHVECKPVAAAGNGTAATTAQSILSDPPKRLTIVTIATSEDTQLNGTAWLVNSKVDVRYSPDGDAVMSFDLVLRLDDSGAAITPVALS